MSDRYATARQLAGHLDARPPARPAAAGRARTHAARERPRQPGTVLVGAAPRAAASSGRSKRDARRLRVERAGAEGKAKALVFDATGISDSTELVELQRFFYPAVGRLERNGRVVVLGTPPAEAGSARAHTAQRALEGFTRSLGQGDRRPRRDRPARLRRRGRRGPARVDPALPALPPLGLRLRPGRPGRHRACAESPRSTGRSRWRAGPRSSPAPRAGSAPRSPRPSPPTAPSVVGLDIPQAAEDLAKVAERTGGAEPIELDITADGRAGADRRAPRRRRRRRRPQRRRHQRPDDREDARGALGDADGDQPLQRGADQRRAARSRPARRQRPHRLRLLDVGDRRQLRPDQLRDLEGGRDRHGRSDGAGAGQAGGDDQRGRAWLHRDPDDRGDADRRARSGPADEQPRPRAACRSTSPRRSPGSPAPPRPGSTATWSASAARTCWEPDGRPAPSTARPASCRSTRGPRRR